MTVTNRDWTICRQAMRVFGDMVRHINDNNLADGEYWDRDVDGPLPSADEVGRTVAALADALGLEL